MIIGINGRKNSGKDTVARMIQYATNVSANYVSLEKWLQDTQPFFTDNHIMYTQFGVDYEIHKFAGKLKEMLSLLLGVPVSMLEDREFKESVLPECWWYYKGETALFQYPNDYTANRKLPLIKPTVRDVMIKLGTDCGRDIIHPNVWINSTLATYKKGMNWIITDLRFPNELNRLQQEDAILINIERPTIEDDNDPIDHKLDYFENWDYKLINDGDYQKLYFQVELILQNIENENIMCRRHTRRL
jgi:hypothetical protein